MSRQKKAFSSSEEHFTSFSTSLIDSRLKRSLTANFEPNSVLLKTRKREREPKESSPLQRTGAKLCPPPLLSRRLLLLKMDWGKRHFRPNLYEESAGGDFYHHHLLIPPLRPRRRTTSTTRKRKREGVDARQKLPPLLLQEGRRRRKHRSLLP